VKGKWEKREGIREEFELKIKRREKIRNGNYEKLIGREIKSSC
jgi:hypothetical protein